MKKSVPIENAVGLALAHDITEIRPGEFKGPAFKKGHLIQEEDLDHFRRLGKHHVYVLRLQEDELHEDDAAQRLARALCGKNVEPKGSPVEGKVKLIAQKSGLFKVELSSLYQFNLLGEVICATLRTNTMVTLGAEVAGTRAIPLVIKREQVERAEAIGASSGGILSVVELPRRKVGVVITGSEIHQKLIPDRFEPVVREKVTEWGSEIVGVKFVPDDSMQIADAIREHLEVGAELIITTGGLSVDPDDVTRKGVSELATTPPVYGAPVLPGAMLLIAYCRQIPIVGIPACGMFSKVTAFDLVFPRLLAGEVITREELAALGHGGLCRQCAECRFPNCSFGMG